MTRGVSKHSINSNIDALGCFVLLGIHYLANKKYSGFSAKLIKNASSSYMFRIPATFGVIYGGLSYLDIIGNSKSTYTVEESYAYKALTYLLQNTAYYYKYNNSENYMGIACIYFVTNLALGLLAKKITGCRYYVFEKDPYSQCDTMTTSLLPNQPYELIKDAALGAAITTSAVIAAELVPIVLGFESIIMKFIIGSMAYAVTTKALESGLRS